MITDGGNNLKKNSEMVRERGLEPPRIAPLVPKTSASTISPLARVVYCKPLGLFHFEGFGRHESLSIIEAKLQFY